MPVIKTVKNTTLLLRSQTGTLSNGKPKYKSNTYSNIAVDAADSDVYAVAKELATLYEADIAEINRHDMSKLVEEA